MIESKHVIRCLVEPGSEVLWATKSKTKLRLVMHFAQMVDLTESIRATPACSLHMTALAHPCMDPTKLPDSDWAAITTGRAAQERCHNAAAECMV